MQRIHRIGQTKSTYSTYMYSVIGKEEKNTIDHYVRSLQNRKIGMARELLGDAYVEKFQIERSSTGTSKLEKLAEWLS